MAVKQIQNALALIEFFADRGTPASLAELQAQFGWPRSSAYNIITTLVERGYMYEPARRGAYYPTRRWLDVAGRIAGADPLDVRLSGMLVRLSEETGETAILAAISGRHSLYIDVVESRSPVRYAAHSGMRVPLHAGASGRALLSLLPGPERQRLLQSVPYGRYGEGALMTPQAVEDEISASARRGWFQSVHEYDADLAAIALPLVLGERRLAVAVAGPVSRLSDRCGDMATILARHIDAAHGPVG